MIKVDPKTGEKIIKGGIAVGTAIVAAVGGWFAGEKGANHMEKKRRKKLDEHEQSRHEKIVKERING